MRPAIRPGLAVFRRGPSHLQLGAAPGTGLVLGDRPGLVEFLRLLDGVRDTTTVGCLARERIPDLADAPEALIAALEREGVVVDATAWTTVDTTLQDEARALAGAGATAAEIRDRLDGRSQSSVELRYDPVAETLVASTAGHLAATGITATTPPGPSATVTLIVSHGLGTQQQSRSLVRQRVPHLCVGIDGAAVHIGPFVHPHITPCVECADRTRAGWDPAWPAIVPQLGKPLAPLDQTPSALSAATRSVAAAVIAEEIATFCDEFEPLTTSRTITIGPGVHDRTDTALDFHPDCACRTL